MPRVDLTPLVSEACVYNFNRKGGLSFLWRSLKQWPGRPSSLTLGTRNVGVITIGLTDEVEGNEKEGYQRADNNSGKI